MSRLFILSFLLIAILLSSCNQVSNLIPLSIDKNIGEQAVSQIGSYGEQFRVLDKDEYPEAYQSLERIKDRILSSGQLAHKDDFPWEMKIVHDDSVLNAFCLPGGYIFVYTGLIKFLDSEDELAGVLGHEMAHADKRHSVKQLSQQMGLSLLIRLIFGFDNATLIDLGANLLSLSFSRGHESEADLSSVNYLYHTEYDARGVMRFFEKLQKNDHNPRLLEFLSTHPAPENRSEKIMEEWNRLGGKKGEKFKDDYAKLKGNLP